MGSSVIQCLLSNFTAQFMYPVPTHNDLLIRNHSSLNKHTRAISFLGWRFSRTCTPRIYNTIPPLHPLGCITVRHPLSNALLAGTRATILLPIFPCFVCEETTPKSARWNATRWRVHQDMVVDCQKNYTKSWVGIAAALHSGWLFCWCCRWSS